ncbi:EVE domain-containing protein [Fortiea contorta]|uniref:EVE domain-containing protein n=1 Tax=Fortiea contorta TaxID=1892405 RepID=UPI000344F2B1|nr:EVE domain-containing protein [Fortiea contorta]
MENIKYWIVVASKNHVQNGVEGGFIQACHGKASPLNHIGVNDWVVYYSPKLEFGGEQKCQAFTAIGQVIGNEVYNYDMGNDFIPYRRDVQFWNCCEIPILRLIPYLNFIKNKRNWGYVFRFGFLEIAQNDFEIIAGQMLCNIEELKGVPIDIYTEKSSLSI